jgi:hypothetical protein
MSPEERRLWLKVQELERRLNMLPLYVVTSASLAITAVNASWQNVNPATGPGLNLPVIGGGSYLLDVSGRYQEGSAQTPAAVPRFQLTGPAVSALDTEFTAQASATGGNVSQSACNGAGTFSAAMAGPAMNSNLSVFFHLRGSFTTTAAGTVQLQANTSTAASTPVIFGGASMILIPL